MNTTTVSENATYLESVGMPYNQVYLLMSVCYILPQIQQNLKKRFSLLKRLGELIPKKNADSKTAIPVADHDPTHHQNL